jgi:hypothetical protein
MANQITKIIFDGLEVKVHFNDGPVASFVAVSGNPLYQNPSFQNIQDTGPLPEGKYHINVEDVDWRDGPVEDVFWGDVWGDVRVTLIPDPSTNLMGRSGFFLHGSLASNG